MYLSRSVRRFSNGGNKRCFTWTTLDPVPGRRRCPALNVPVPLARIDAARPYETVVAGHLLDAAVIQRHCRVEANATDLRHAQRSSGSRKRSPSYRRQVELVSLDAAMKLLAGRMQRLATRQRQEGVGLTRPGESCVNSPCLLMLFDFI